MPKLRNRDGGKKGDRVPTLRETMGLSSGPRIGVKPVSKKVTNNILGGGNKKGSRGRKGISSKAGYDVKTRVHLPSAKGAAKKSRTSTKKGV